MLLLYTTPKPSCMVPTSFPVSIDGYTIDYAKTAQENLDTYFNERLAHERRAVRGRLRSIIDAEYQSNTAGVLIFAGFLLFGILLLYSSLTRDEFKQEDFFWALGVAVAGGLGLVYSYGKIKIEKRLTEEIQQSEEYREVVSFFTTRWLSMECKSVIEALREGQKRAQQLHEDYWVERTKNEVAYPDFLPLGIGKELREIQNLAQTLETLYGVLERVLYQLLTHQQTHAPNLNQEKVFYFSKAHTLVSLAQEASNTQTSAEAEKVLQKLLDVVKQDELYS